MDRRDVLERALAIAAAACVPRSRAAEPAGERRSASERPAAGERAMITRKIPSTGEAIPVIGLGTSGPFEVGTGAAARAPLAEVLRAFFEGGGTLIDTSPMYSSAERVLGELLTPQMQQKAFIATKVWTDGERPGVEQMTQSAELLRRKRLDLIQVHNLRDLATHLKTLRRWKDEGQVRYVGITHYTVGSHAELARVIERERIDFVQLNYSPVTRDAERRLLPLAAERGVAVLVNRAFEDGQLFDRVRGKPVPDWAGEFDATSWAQVFLKYVIANPAVTCVIPATGKVKNMLDNLAGGRGRLPDETQLARITQTLDAM